MSTITSISPRISLIDGFDLGLKERTGTYVIQEEKITLVESGPSPSVPHILKGLKTLAILPEQVDYLIVTHIHLDHAGGAGLLLEKCPNAKLIVHPKGARHLVDPSRLIAGAQAVYQDKFDALFQPIIPIDEDRLLIKNDLDTLEIGPNCNLTFYDTPGHAFHHFSILDPGSNGIFTGDTLGVHYESLAKDGIHFVLPSTSPNQFNPEAMIASLERIQSLHVDTIFFGHYSASHQPVKVYEQVKYWLERFVSIGKNVEEGNGTVNQLSQLLLTSIQNELDELGVSRSHPVYEHIQLDLQICSIGILDYLRKQEKGKGKGYS
ncbi:MBL fold metallo-hydrolase [Halalkalibacter alkalisediminis]|uniref:MBL fold metallo-hydrolase n=1 Tax=Halalkalibacter alkalisediminis TaxID=935616 RepID=A0ABV6NHP0_9BACI|nr:MBL fold metallo-hydrolase [Halalkalibacter alkalisediminis]